MQQKIFFLSLFLVFLFFLPQKVLATFSLPFLNTDFPVYYNYVHSLFNPQQPTDAVSTTTVPSGIKTMQSGPCSPQNLLPAFGDITSATIASCICAYESGGNTLALNNACTKGITADYSVGLFQINMDTTPPRCQAFSATGMYCAVSNQDALNRCISTYEDPSTNIAEAVTIYKAGHGWDSGWHAEKSECF